MNLLALFALWRSELQRRSVQRIFIGLILLNFVVAFGVFGYMELGWSFSDAFYQVIITISGVGLGEVHPMVTTSLRNHTMMVIALGIFAVAYTLGGFIQLLTEGELEEALGHTRMRRQIDELTNHVVIAGFGRVGKLVSVELEQAKVPFLIVEINSDRIPELERLKYLYVQGDATEEETLKAAKLDKARSLVTAMPSDADNVFITLTARQMAPKVEIIARAEMPATQKKMLQAGADHVVLPAVIGAHRIASLLTQPSVVEFSELVTHQPALGIEINEFVVQKGGRLEGLTLRTADVGRLTGSMVVAIKRNDGSVQFPPSGDEALNVDDIIVVLGRKSNLAEFRANFTP